MANKIDSVGVYVGEIKESGLSTTKNGFPQSILRLRAEKKFVDDAEGMKHFKLEEQAWVDWSSFDEEIVGYFVLFNSPEEFSPDTALLNYEQLQIATGWDGTEFDSLSDGRLNGKKVQFRVAINEYNGKTSLQVNWLDKADADPVRQLKSLDAAGVKALNAKLRIVKKAAPAKPAKPTAAAVPTSAASAPKVSTPAPAALPAVSPKPSPASPASTVDTAAPPKGNKKKTPTAPPPASSGDLPAESTQLEAWEYVNSKKGENDDQTVTDAWIAACQEVGGDKDEDKFTPADWAKVRTIVIKDLAL
jgi:hypothetical protein